MAWNTILVERLRFYINDLDSSSYKWTDVQLEKFLAISAIDVTTELQNWQSTINGPYTITTNSSGSNLITPDPVENAPAGFSNLIVAKAGCRIQMSDVIRLTAQGAGWKIVDDRSTIDGTQALVASKETARNYCESYQKMLLEFRSGNRYVGNAILTPYVSPNFDPKNIQYDDRRPGGC